MNSRSKFFRNSSPEIIALSAFQDLLSSIATNESHLKRLVISDEGQIGDAIDTRKSILKLAIEDFRSKLRPLLGTASSAYSDELTYIGVSLADDRIIKLDWKFSNKWADSPLEYDVFGSRNAGQEIFTRIESVLEQNASNKVLNLLYFWMLCSGFSGKYERLLGSTEIVSLKKSLLESGVKQRLDNALSRSLLEPFIIASSDFKEKKFLPTSKPYYKFIVLSVITFAILTTLLWLYNTSELRQLLNSAIKFGVN